MMNRHQRLLAVSEASYQTRKKYADLYDDRFPQKEVSDYNEHSPIVSATPEINVEFMQRYERAYSDLMAANQLGELVRQLNSLAELLQPGTETKVRHVRTPSAWPGSPPVGTPLPLPASFTAQSATKPSSRSVRKPASTIDYRGNHQAPTDGPSMDWLEESFPDFYEHPEYYLDYATDASDRVANRQTTRAIKKARGYPDNTITIYRAVPPGVDTINPGDWVTPSSEYAKKHGRHATDPEKDWPVISREVPAKELFTDGNSPHEWGWMPEEHIGAQEESRSINTERIASARAEAHVIAERLEQAVKQASGFDDSDEDDGYSSDQFGDAYNLGVEDLLGEKGGFTGEGWAYDLSVAEAAALGPWVYFGGCRTLRKTASEMLGFRGMEEGGSTEPNRGWGGEDYVVAKPDAFAYALLKSLQTDSAIEGPLYRGVKLGDVDESDFLQEGDEFVSPLVSFANEKDIAADFGHVILVLDQAKAIAGTDMGPPSSWSQERQDHYYDDDNLRTSREYISGGRFKVERIEYGEEQTLIHLKQLGVYDPDTGILTKADAANRLWKYDYLFDVPLSTPTTRTQRKGDGFAGGEDKVRHVRTPSAWPGNPPVGTPLPLPDSFGVDRAISPRPAPKPRIQRSSASGGSSSPTTRKPAFKKPTAPAKRPSRTSTDAEREHPYTADLAAGYHKATEAERKEAKIPPAYTDVMVPDDPSKSAYRYLAKNPAGKTASPRSRWFEVQNSLKKYARNKKLTAMLPRVDAKMRELSKTDESAAALWMVRLTGMRNSSTQKPLSSRQMRENREHLAQAKKNPKFNPDTYKPKHYISYGASNLEARHVTINKDSVRFRFRGKKYVAIDITVKDPELVELMTQWMEGKSHRDQVFPNTNQAKNVAKLREISGDGEMKVHDLRTLKATSMAMQHIAKVKRPPNSPKEFIQMQKEVGKEVSAILGNQPGEAIRSYIDPMVFDSWRKPEWGKIPGDVLFTDDEGE
jgi:DNA topoisomerase IB